MVQLCAGSRSVSWGLDPRGTVLAGHGHATPSYDCVVPDTDLRRKPSDPSRRVPDRPAGPLLGSEAPKPLGRLLSGLPAPERLPLTAWASPGSTAGSPRHLKVQSQGATATLLFGAAVASVLVGLGYAWLGAAMSRIVAVVAFIPSAWQPGAWAGIGMAVGALAAHRYGGTSRRESWLLALGAILISLGLAVGAVPVVHLPQLVHRFVVTGGWVGAAVGTGIVGGVALRRSMGMPALVLGAFVAGQGAAASTAPALSNGLGVPALALVAGTCASAASIVLGLTGGQAWRSAPGLLATSTAVIAFLGLGSAGAGIGSEPNVAADPSRIPVAKSLFESVSSSDDPERHVAMRWGSAGRLDVTETPSGARWIYLDGFPVGVVGPQGRMRPDGSLLPFTLPGKGDRVLIVGLGGGQEVRAALESGATSVTVAEPHPGAFEVVAEAYADAGGPAILASDRVHLVAEEARAYLRASDDRFDLIILTLAAAGTAAEPGRPVGATLYTREAIGDYLAHLEPEGMVAIRVRDEHELWRTFNTAFQAMSDAGSLTPTDAIRHLLAVNDGTAGGTLEDIALPIIFVRRTPFPADVAGSVQQFLLQAPFPPLFLPYQEERSALSILGTEDGPARTEAGAPFDIAPVHDDRPYFFEAEKGLPWGIISTLVALGVASVLATWLASRRPTDFADLDDEADADALPELDRRPDLADPVPWRFLSVATIAGIGAGLTSSVLLWRLPLIAGRADLTNAAGALALATGAVLAAIAINRSPMHGVRAIAGWGALGAAALPFVIAEAASLGAHLLHGQSLETRVAAGALALLPVGIGVGSQVPAILRMLAGARRPGWEAMTWGTSLAAGAVGVALAQVASRATGDVGTAGIGACLHLACFLAIGLRWIDGQPATAPDGRLDLQMRPRGAGSV